MFNLFDFSTKFVEKQHLSLRSCTKNLVIMSRSISMNNRLHLTYVFELLNYMQQLFTDVTCIDHLEKHYRFSLMYTFLSLIPKTTLFLELKTKMDLETTAPTSAYTYFAAIAAEREIYDLFGIIFVNHPDLRRILTDYSFVGHPLRKDYPLTGVSELKFSTAKKRIIASLIVLPQEYRDMQYSISWVNLD